MDVRSIKFIKGIERVWVQNTSIFILSVSSFMFAAIKTAFSSSSEFIGRSRLAGANFNTAPSPLPVAVHNYSFTAEKRLMEYFN